METLYSPAKINLGIAVKEKLTNGWHEIENVLMAIPFYDEIKIDLDESGEIIIDCDDKNVPISEGNFIYQAIKKISEQTKRKIGAKIVLQKRIAAGGGFGGGSVNAAVILKYVNEKLQLNLSNDELIKIAKEISGDSVFYLVGDLIYETKHGLPNENGTLEKLPALPHCYLLIVSPHFTVVIKEAYEILDKNFVPSTYKIEKLVQAIKENNLLAIAQNIHNDFEEKISEVYPEIANMKNALQNNGALAASMNGKGPSVFGIFESREEMLLAKKNLSEKIEKADIFDLEIGAANA